MGNSLLLKNAFGECIRLVSLARSCAANAVCINYFMQVHFSPLVHIWFPLLKTSTRQVNWKPFWWAESKIKLCMVFATQKTSIEKISQKNKINSMKQLEKQVSLLLKLSGSTIFGKLLELPCPRVTSYKQPALCNQEKKYDEPHVLPT